MQPDLAWLVGLAVDDVTFTESDGEWWFTLAGGTHLGVMGSWQLIADGKVALASGDQGQRYGLSKPVDAVEQATGLLRGRAVERITLAPASSDVTVHFAGDVELRTFNPSHFEGWRLIGPAGQDFVAQGGGTVCRIRWEGDRGHGEPIRVEP
jgi:hypothetical protein